jgi:hypothetical protein
MTVVRATILDGPVLHCIGNLTGNAAIKWFSVRHRPLKKLKRRGGQSAANILSGKSQNAVPVAKLGGGITNPSICGDIVHASWLHAL